MNDWAFHVAELVLLGVPLWGGSLYMLFVLRLYPPHRHVNGSIEYPPRFEPGKVERMK